MLSPTQFSEGTHTMTPNGGLPVTVEAGPAGNTLTIGSDVLTWDDEEECYWATTPSGIRIVRLYVEGLVYTDVTITTPDPAGSTATVGTWA